MTLFTRKYIILTVILLISVFTAYMLIINLDLPPFKNFTSGPTPAIPSISPQNILTEIPYQDLNIKYKLFENDYIKFEYPQNFNAEVTLSNSFKGIENIKISNNNYLFSISLGNNSPLDDAFKVELGNTEITRLHKNKPQIDPPLFYDRKIKYINIPSLSRPFIRFDNIFLNPENYDFNGNRFKIGTKFNKNQFFFNFYNLLNYTDKIILGGIRETDIVTSENPQLTVECAQPNDFNDSEFITCANYINRFFETVERKDQEFITALENIKEEQDRNQPDGTSQIKQELDEIVKTNDVFKNISYSYNENGYEHSFSYLGSINKINNEIEFKNYKWAGEGTSIDFDSIKIVDDNIIFGKQTFTPNIHMPDQTAESIKTNEKEKLKDFKFSFKKILDKHISNIKTYGDRVTYKKLTYTIDSQVFRKYLLELSGPESSCIESDCFYNIYDTIGINFIPKVYADIGREERSVSSYIIIDSNNTVKEIFLDTGYYSNQYYKITNITF